MASGLLEGDLGGSRGVLMLEGKTRGGTVDGPGPLEFMVPNGL